MFSTHAQMCIRDRFNGGLVPWYILCVRYLHMKNSIWALILPLMFSVWNMIIAKTFMSGIPAAITESAKIDGANDIVIFIKPVAYTHLEKSLLESGAILMLSQ